ncbi:ABC transporter ATP-binding protein [Bifidobacterium myosotis]|nr:ABC transporter ATP-binding protein [Bifidobacterium myosotis]
MMTETDEINETHDGDVLLCARHISAQVPLPDGSVLPIVKDASLTVRSGQSYAIVGKSGSGKTSLISILGLLNANYHGSLTIDGMDMASLSDSRRAQLRASRIGFVFQNYSLIPQLNVWENVALPMEYAHQGTTRQRKDRAMECLGRVGLADRARNHIRMLSGGEQQRVAIARALACAPQLIICDEPTGALDTGTGDAIMTLLMDLVASGRRTLILVTHDPDIAALCNHRLHMDGGRLTACSE